jgi:hypothetical protein
LYVRLCGRRPILPATGASPIPCCAALSPKSRERPLGLAQLAAAGQAGLYLVSEKAAASRGLSTARRLTGSLPAMPGLQPTEE